MTKLELLKQVDEAANKECYLPNEICMKYLFKAGAQFIIDGALAEAEKKIEELDGFQRLMRLSVKQENKLTEKDSIILNLEQKIDKLTECLRFYAMKESWNGAELEAYDGGDVESGTLDTKLFPHGKRARQVLSEIKD